MNECFWQRATPFQLRCALRRRNTEHHAALSLCASLRPPKPLGPGRQSILIDTRITAGLAANPRPHCCVWSHGCYAAKRVAQNLVLLSKHVGEVRNALHPARQQLRGRAPVGARGHDRQRGAMEIMDRSQDETGITRSRARALGRATRDHARRRSSGRCARSAGSRS